MNITSFIAWFIQQFIRIGQTLLAKLDEIILYGNISLMDFIITIAIIGAFIEIVVTAPRLGILNKATKERRENDK